MPGIGLPVDIHYGTKCLPRSYLFFYYIEGIFLPEYLEDVKKPSSLNFPKYI